MLGIWSIFFQGVLGFECLVSGASVFQGVLGFECLVSGAFVFQEMIVSPKMYLEKQAENKNESYHEKHSKN